MSPKKKIIFETYDLDVLSHALTGIRELYNELKVIEQTGKTKLQIRKVILKRVEKK